MSGGQVTSDGVCVCVGDDDGIQLPNAEIVGDEMASGLSPSHSDCEFVFKALLVSSVSAAKVWHGCVVFICFQCDTCEGMGT